MTNKKDQLTTILKTGNQATITFAKSLLEDAGIKFFIKNEGLQNLFGAGKNGTIRMGCSQKRKILKMV